MFYFIYFLLILAFTITFYVFLNLRKDNNRNASSMENEKYSELNMIKWDLNDKKMSIPEEYQKIFNLCFENKNIGENEFFDKFSDPTSQKLRSLVTDLVASGKTRINKEVKFTEKDGFVNWFIIKGTIISKNKIPACVIFDLAKITSYKYDEKIREIMNNITNKAMNIDKMSNFYKLIRNELNKILETSNFFIALYNKDKDELYFPYIIDKKDYFEKVSAKSTISKLVLTEQKTYLLSDEDIERLARTGKIKLIGTRAKSWLGVPLIIEKKSAGLLVIQNYETPNAYNLADKKLLQFLAAQLSYFIKNKQVEDKIKRVNNQLTSILNTMQDAIYSLELPSQKLILTSKSIENVFGVKKEDFYENPMLYTEMIHPEDKEKIKNATYEIFKNQKGVWTYRIVRPDGDIRWVKERSQIIKNNLGKPIRIDSIFTDITKEKKAKNEIKESNEKFKTIAENIPGVIFVYDFLPGGIRKNVYTGPGMKELLGETEDHDVLYNIKKFFESIPEKDKKRIKKETKLQEDIGLPLDVQYRVKVKKGKYKWLRSISSSRKIDKNKYRVIGILLDISTQKQINDKLIESQKMDSIGKLAGGIAHDFNNLLGVISGYISILKKSNEGQDNISMFNDIEEAITKSIDITHTLLALARKEKNLKRDININQTIEKMLELLKRTSKTKHDIVFEKSPNIKAVNADNYQLTQALMNICQNSLEAMKKDGRLTIKTRLINSTPYLLQKFPILDTNQLIQIEIIDTVKGIDKENLKNIFEPFFTTKKSSKLKSSGLGLTTSYSIIKNHNGAIEVHSSKNTGTSFIIYLPVAKKDQLTAKNSTQNTATKKCNNVLIVDDEKIFRKMLKKMLDKLGIGAETAQNGKECLKIVKNKKEDFDCILLDLRMPGLNGNQVLEELKKMDIKSKIIITTGSNNKEEAEKLISLGADSILNKPFDIGKVSELLT